VPRKFAICNFVLGTTSKCSNLSHKASEHGVSLEEILPGDFVNIIVIHGIVNYGILLIFLFETIFVRYCTLYK